MAKGKYKYIVHLINDKAVKIIANGIKVESDDYLLKDENGRLVLVAPKANTLCIELSR